MRTRVKFLTVGIGMLLGSALYLAAQETPVPPTTPPPPLFKGDKPKKDDHTRQVAGIVRDPAEKPAESVVKLKDMKTLAIRSFITKDNGV